MTELNRAAGETTAPEVNAQNMTVWEIKVMEMKVLEMKVPGNESGGGGVPRRRQSDRR